MDGNSKREITIDAAHQIDDLQKQLVKSKNATRSARRAAKKKSIQLEEAYRELEQACLRAERLAFYDALTGLPNRRLFDERLEQNLLRAKRDILLLAILYIDIDRFKQINDTYGHTVGDKALREIGHRLRQCVRAPDTVVRLGGDEFAIILNALSDVETATIVADRIHQSIARPNLLTTHNLAVSVSIGIVTYPDDAGDAAELILGADLAMYQAKRKGRGLSALFSDTNGENPQWKEGTSVRLSRIAQR